MGYFFNRQNAGALPAAIIKLDKAQLTALHCTKSPEDFLRDFIMRGPVSGLVILNASSTLPGPTRTEMAVLFADAADLHDLAAAPAHVWADCATQITNVPNGGAGTTHLILTVSSPGAAPATAVPVAASLLF